MENNLTIEQENIKSEVFKILNIIDNFQEEFFDENIKNINELAESVNLRRNKLKEIYPDSELKKFNLEFDSLIKQIVNRFDNIINKIKSEQSEISIELNNFQNKKKLANYYR